MSANDWRTKHNSNGMQCLLHQIPLFLLILTVGYSSSLTAEQGKKLRIYNWEDYLPQTVIQAFEKKHGQTIELVHYETDDLKDELIAQTGGQGLDMIIGSGTSLIAYVRRNNILGKIDHEIIPNRNNLDPVWQTHFPELTNYAYPYLWGTLGITYRKDKMQTEITSWNDLLNPHISLKGKILMINDARDAFTPALKSLGYSVNSSSANEIIEAGRLLANQSEFTDYGYIDISEQSELVTARYWMALTYNGDALTVKKHNNNIEFVVPKEGSNIWVDYIGIFQSSKNKVAAHQFINFINEPEIAKEISLSLYYATANKAALALLPPEHLENKTIYPDKDVLEKSEIYKPLSGKAIGRYNNTFLNVFNKKRYK